MKTRQRLLSVLFFALIGSAVGADEGVSVRILGSGEPGYNAERAEAAVLVSFGAEQLLVDMGNGTQAGLSKAGLRAPQLAALIITHHHIDHNQELIPILANALLRQTAPMAVGPAGIKAQADFARNFYQEDIAYRRANIGTPGSIPIPEVKEIKGGEEFTLGGITVKTAAVNHSIETIAYRFEKDGKSVVVSGDLYYSESLIKLAKNADILVLDGSPASMPNGRGSAQNGKPRSHSTFDEIITMVKESSAKTVVLNHLPNRAIDEAAVRAAFTKAGVASQIVFAYDGQVL